MGAWGILPFENDSALDAMVSWLNPAPFEHLKTSLQSVAATPLEGYLEEPQGSEGYAAAAWVACFLGYSKNILPSELVSHPYQPSFIELEELRVLASQALSRLSQENCELLELWSEDEEVLREFLPVFKEIMEQVNHK